MRRPQLSIGGLLVLTACVAIVLGILSRPWEQLATGLLTLAMIVAPSTCLMLRHGPDRWRATALDWARSLLTATLTLLAITAGLLVMLAAVAILAATVLLPFDNPVLLVAVPTVLALVAASLAARFAHGTRREFGWGFALFGWPSLIFGLAPAVIDRAPAPLSVEALHWAYQNLYLNSYPGPAPDVPTLGPVLPRLSASRRSAPALARSTMRHQSYLRFQRIGHYLIVLCLATTGGQAARSLAARRGPSPARRDGPPPTLAGSIGAHEAAPL